MKKVVKIFYFIFFIFTIFLLISCDNKPKEMGIKIIEYPKINYYIDEDYNFDDLKVVVYYDNNSEEIIYDYHLIFNDKIIGNNTISIKYKQFTTDFIVTVYEYKTTGIKITKYPKLVYSYDEQFDFCDMEVTLCFENGDEVIIDNYKIFYDNTIFVGENKITINYLDYTVDFIIIREEPTKKELFKHSNYKEVTTMEYSYNNYTLKYDNVYYGMTRDTNMFIVYDELYYIKTNIYGYEAAVDRYGKVVEVGVNVSLPEGGIVLSAHGTRRKDVQSIELNDYVLYFDNSVFVYKNYEINKYNDIFIKFYNYIEYLEKINDIVEYNKYVDSLNTIIPLLENIYNGDNSIDINLINKVLNIQDCFNPYNHVTTYSYIDITYDYLYMDDNASNNYNLINIYDGNFYVGGFRNANSLVLYDIDHYMDRNSYGYEVGVNKDGIVVSKDVLVNLEEDGYILSGHSSAATFIIDNINIYDKIEIIDNKVYVYRNYFSNNKKLFIDERNSLIDKINLDIENEIPHDYEYIYKMVSELDNILLDYTINEGSIYNVNEYIKKAKVINEYLSVIYSLLIEYKPDETHGIWYYPFYKNELFDDTSYDGIIITLDKFQKMGINEIIIYPFKNGYCLFESKIFKIYPELNNYDYGEYSHDYLKCFIEEAHKRNICVNAFTQTFSEHISTMYNGDESYYQIDYNGDKSKGNIYYYDICNDEIQSQLIEWYKELVIKYDFDKVEYDIIRYPNSNLYKYLDVDEIPNTVVITDHGYTDYSIQKFMGLYNYSGDLKELIKTNKDVRYNWLQFKEQKLIDFITNCTNEMKKINPNLIVTAAVLDNPENAKKTYLQDYGKWLELNIVDEIEVMSYTFSCEQLENIIASYENLLDEYPVRIGISPRLDGRNILIDVKQLLQINKYEGFIIFANTLYYDNLFNNILTLSGLSKNYSFLNTKEELWLAKTNCVIFMVENYYSKLNGENYNQLLNSLRTNKNIKENLELISDVKMKDYLITFLYD